jgi:hypothetical protein
VSGEIIEYGFTWGPMTVTRLTEIDGSVCLGVDSEHHKLQITVSPQGRSVRVWKDHREMT